ncbi:STA10 protein, partial [Phainopepla nitens]|nr:STA10 protein [Phainopepla nitens]
MSRGGEMVYIPDDSDFSSFRDQCESLEGWHCRYNKAGVTVWSQGQEESCTVQKIKTRISCKDVPAETLYDVLHDTRYRKKWDSNMIETYDIGRLTVNADVGYYSWEGRGGGSPRARPAGSPSPGHPAMGTAQGRRGAHPSPGGAAGASPGAGPASLSDFGLWALAGSLPKWVVNRVSQFVAPKAMKKIYKAGLKYPEWKRRHDPEYKPWVYPEQNTLPSVSLAELSVQHADSLENIDETGLPEDHLSASDHEA